jgi:Fructose-bisphosphate aldolase class-I
MCAPPRRSGPRPGGARGSATGAGAGQASQDGGGERRRGALGDSRGTGGGETANYRKQKNPTRNVSGERRYGLGPGSRPVFAHSPNNGNRAGHENRVKESAMTLAELNNAAEPMVAPGRGILAAVESSGTIKKRFEDNRAESNSR